MNSFELNKVAGAVLGTLLFAFGTGFLAELIYTPKPAGKAGYALPGGGEGGEHGGAAPAAGGEAAAPKEGIAALLASADAEKGKAGTKACQACHSFEKGGPNKMGPDLWEVVGRKKGSHEGFGYSDAMKAKGGDWTFEDLDHFLTKPSEYVKGTKMAFQGIANAQERANVIAYLRTLSENPKPLPAAEKKEEGKPAAGESKPVEGEKKPDAKPAGKAEEAKPADKAAEPEKKADDAKPAEKTAAPAKAEDAKPSDTSSEPEKTTDDAKPADGATKPDEGEPAEAKPTEAEPKPADKPADEKSEGDTKPEDAKPQ